MNRKKTLIILFLGLFGKLIAQNVTIEAQIDSLQILIGEQTKIRLEATVDNGQEIIFPHFRDTIVRGVEVLETLKPDTQYLNNKQRLHITQEYLITSFDSALYYLPPLSVLVDQREYKSKALALKVYTIPVDTENPDHFFGQKTVMKPPFVWEDWWLLIALSFVFIPILVLLFYLIVRLRDNKPIIRKIKVEPKIPPHKLAMQEIERIKNEKSWQKGEPKAYYTELTDVIRTYIDGRYGFNAMEMTSSEIIDKLMSIGNKEDIKELRLLFQTADLVKFAKHSPLMNENDANLINAIDFINETKSEEEENAKPQPTEITIIEKRSLRSKIILITSIVALATGSVVALTYIVIRLIELLS
ncbi:hypothetical protein D0T50_08590 [Bacteroides sp. 214]|uniref:protein BatD n=1 Tax=Bacteroides sp. 214 TaxID=2302935 RepID=UPI0013D45051|nr:protein BatD [Bacteroides sp. 214]NDW12948.1 hypothetical protein [Bacteroides sp. 214]